MRTETTINDSRDFAHRQTAVQPARAAAGRLLRQPTPARPSNVSPTTRRSAPTPSPPSPRPAVVGTQRAAALRFDDPRAHALLSALLVFRLLPRGSFTSRDLRAHLAPLLGVDPGDPHDQGRLTYQLRRLRLHGLIERIPGTHRYRVTDIGLRTALFLTRAHNRLLSPGLAELTDPRPTAYPPNSAAATTRSPPRSTSTPQRQAWRPDA